VQIMSGGLQLVHNPSGPISLSTEVVEAYNVIPNLDLLIPSLLREGTAFSASSLAMVPGTPIPPMLARITNGSTQALKDFSGKSFTCMMVSVPRFTEYLMDLCEYFQGK